MIVKALIQIIMLPLRGLLDLLPTIEAPDVSGMIAAIQPVWQFAGWVNNFFPLTEAVTIFGVLIVAFQAVLVVRGVLWVLSKAHILGGE